MTNPTIPCAVLRELSVASLHERLAACEANDPATAEAIREVLAARARVVLHPFGSAPSVVPKDYSLTMEVQGTEEELQRHYAGKDVVLVRSAELGNKPDQIVVGLFVWMPVFSRWRHGGWYVSNLRYPSGACGCVSNNYPDGKWRIACDSRRTELNAPGDFTFKSRTEAARAERELILSMPASLAA